MQIPPVNKVKVLVLNQQTDKAGCSCMHATKNLILVKLRQYEVHLRNECSEVSPMN